MLRVATRARLAIAVSAAVLLALAASLVLEARRAPGAFAGDNGRIAIQTDRSGGDSQIFTMNKQGGDLKQLTHASTYVGAPAYSRSAGRILFTQLVGGKGDIFVMD